MIASNKAASELAEWIALQHPQLFAALARAATPQRLNGFTDWLSSVGTGVTSAVKSVGTFLTSSQGLSTLGTLAGTYMQTKAQQNVLQTQVALAQAGYPPAPIVNAPSSGGVMTPFYAPTQQPVTSSLLQQLQPSFLQQNLPWLIAGGGALLLMFVFSRGSR